MPNSVLTKVTGVNVAGYLTAETGIGAAVRGYVSAIEAAGLQVALNNFEVNLKSRNTVGSLTRFATNNPFSVNLICVNADQLGFFVQSVGEKYFEDKYNIGVWWWELPDFPQEWWQRFCLFDEIWVGSTFIQQSIAKSSPIPVVTIPPVIKEPQVRSYSKETFGLSSEEFVFLYVFDFLSGFERKNPLAVVEAFKRAFSENEPARLIIKAINAEENEACFNKLAQATAGARITLFDQCLSEKDNFGLIACCDCYVSLHRSEGLGLPMAEAMLLQKPVIATGWSGNMDFTTVNNSYLVPYRLVTNDTLSGPYKIGEVWADPNIDESARLMRYVYEFPHTRSERAMRGCVDIMSRYSVDAVSSLVKSRILAAQTFFSGGVAGGRPKKELSSFYLGTRAESDLQALESWSSAQDSARDQMTNRTWRSIKKLLRRLFTLVFRQDDYNATNARLLRQACTELGALQSQMSLLDERTRRRMVESDARIRELEKSIEEHKRNYLEMSVK
jgi:glycosyltransferase involved in cell wall biosynthesis